MASSTQKIQKHSPANFLEALQTLGKEVVSDAQEQLGIGGPLRPNESFSLNDIMAAEKRGEQAAENKFTSRLYQVKEEDRIAALRREEQAQGQIKALQQEIQMLAKSLGDFGREAQIAALQAPVNPGIYHKSFFEQLRAFIKTLRQRVQDSRNWLATQNARGKKRQGAYWTNVQQSGTKYMLSGERYMVTTTG